MYIKRSIEPIVQKMLKTFKVLLLTGARQVGKSTMIQHVLSGQNYQYITLDDYNELAIAKQDPKLFFLNHPGRLIIDEIQYAPELFREIKLRVDQNQDYGQYVLTGSQTFSLMHRVTESLAGRVGIIRLDGLALREILQDPFSEPVIPNEGYLRADRKALQGLDLWEKIHRGSLPELSKNLNLDGNLYYSAYVSTYLERDVRAIINVQNLGVFAAFIQVLAARTAQMVNYSEIAKEVGVDSKTIKSWLAVLEASGIIVMIHPFVNNQLTRVIKSPVLYFMDTGLVAYLLRWTTAETLMTGAMSGPILENFAVSEIIKSFHNAGITAPPIYYYRDKDQREIDLIVESSGVLYPIEIKHSASPHPKMAKHFALLSKAEGFTLGNQMILCQVAERRYLDEHLLAYPIGAI